MYAIEIPVLAVLRQEGPKYGASSRAHIHIDEGRVVVSSRKVDGQTDRTKSRGPFTGPWGSVILGDWAKVKGLSAERAVQRTYSPCILLRNLSAFASGD